MRILLATILVLLFSIPVFAQDVSVSFNYGAVANSFILYQDGTSMCWVDYKDTAMVDGKGTLVCPYDSTTIGIHEYYMTAVVNGVESLPSPTVLHEKVLRSGDVLIPAIIEMFQSKF